MATTVDNPFDTQQPNPTSSTTTTAPATNPMNVGTNANTQYQQYNPTPVAPQTYTAKTSDVNKATDTVQGQVDSILAKDNPLMQRARTMATQQMAQRGLVNTSMNAGAGVAAMTDQAAKIGSQDADMYSRRAMFNTDAQNQAAQFNTGQTNDMAKFGQEVASRFGLQAEQNKFVAGQNQIQNTFQEKMAILEQSGLDFRQARDIASREAIFSLEQQGITNRFDQEIALKSDMFNAEQNNLERRQIIENNARLAEIGLKIDADRQMIPTNFAANISNTTMAGVAAILADGALKPEAKKAAIDNLVAYSNSQVQWAEAFYATSIPRIRTPDSPPIAATSPVVTKPVETNSYGYEGAASP